MGIGRFMMMAVCLSIDLICILLLRRNLYKLYMKKENGKVQSAEIKRWKAVYYLRPTFYEIEVEYWENGDKKQQTMISCSQFLKKYQSRRRIKIVTIPGTDFVFPEEEKWLVQNMELRAAIVIFSIGILFGITSLLVAGLLGTWSMVSMYCIAILLFLFLYMLYKGFSTERCRHKTRMKYTTSLSCEEVIERLRKEMKNDFHFKKEKEDIKDKMYILSMNGRPLFNQKGVYEKARYRVLITPTQEGSAVWFYLLECRDKYGLNRYAKKLKSFMEKRVDAVRVE